MDRGDRMVRASRRPVSVGRTLTFRVRVGAVVTGRGIVAVVTSVSFRLVVVLSAQSVVVPIWPPVKRR